MADDTSAASVKAMEAGRAFADKAPNAPKPYPRDPYVPGLEDGPFVHGKRYTGRTQIGSFLYTYYDALYEVTEEHVGKFQFQNPELVIQAQYVGPKAK